MKITIRFISFLALVLILSCSQGKYGNYEITQEDLYAHIDFLASDSLMGRQPGTPYDRVAAKYIKDVMESSGLKLLDRNGFQFLDFVDQQELGLNNALSLNGANLELNKHYAIFPFSSSDTLSAAVVFAGYGLNFTSINNTWDDYNHVDVTGKWVMMLRGGPNFDDTENAPTFNMDDRNKALNAKDKGAAGVVLVSGDKFDPQDELVSTKSKSFSVGIPVLQVTREVANRILRPYGKSISDIESTIEQAKSSSSFSISSSLNARTNIVTRKKNTQNVVALVPGSDPTLRSQYIVVGAHYDHLGMGGKGSSSRTPDTLAVHNGADDNASGVAAVLEIGQKLVNAKPKRSVVIVAFAAEELGLLGSRFFIDNPVIPADSIIAMVNADMLGRLNENTLQVGGVKTSVEFDSLLNTLNPKYNFNLSLSPQGYGPSDHASFYAKNIPVLFYSTGAHSDYHTPDDVIDRINIEGLTAATNFIYDMVWELANLPSRPVFKETGPAISPMGRSALKVKFGIMPDVSAADSTGLRVLAVNENQPAWVAGIQKNDVITAINGKKVSNIHDYMFRLQDLKVGSTASVELIRNGKSVVVLVQL